MACCEHDHDHGGGCCDDNSVQVIPERTPNPLSVRFTINRTFLEKGGRNFNSAEKAKGSPLPEALFALPGITGVMVARNFVTVTAQPGTDWSKLWTTVEEAILKHVESGQPAVSAAAAAETSTSSEIEAGINKVLDEEIRPAIAMDGGDVEYVGYQDGIVRLRLRGACHGCPSAAITLKMGIEHRLKQQFEEIVAVEGV
jgi:Fe-S cluster biogenesis protein NfuA